MNNQYLNFNISNCVESSQRQKPTVNIPRKTPFSIVPLKYPRVNNSLHQTLDLDSLFGHMSYATFKKAYKSNIQMDINNSPLRVFSHDNVVKINYKFHLETDSPKSIKKLPHCRLGTSLSTEFGSLDIFIVLLNSSLSAQELKSVVYSQIKTSILDLGQQASSFFFSKVSEIKTTGKNALNFEEIKCNVSCGDFMMALDHLFNVRFRDDEPVIFFETFGNKRSTITTDINIFKLKDKIFSTFDRKYEKYIFVDVCLSVSCGPGTVTFARPSFFHQVKTSPNFSPLFSDAVLNCHREIKNPSLKSMNSGIGIFKNCFKLNFYSTFRYFFNFDKSSDYQFPLSLNMFLNDIYGHSVGSTKEKLNKLISFFEGVENASISDVTGGSCFYRSEIRCNLTKVESTLSRLKKHLTCDNFGYFESTDFFKIIQINLDNFLDLIRIKSLEKKDNDFDSKVFSMITEYIMKTLYISGSKPTSIFSKTINDVITSNISRFHDSVGILLDLETVVDKVFNILTTNDKYVLLRSQVLYASNLTNVKKELLSQVLTISFGIIPIDINSCIKWMLETYLIEKQNCLFPDFELLMNHVDHQNSINIITALKKIFISSSDSKRSSVAKVMYTFFKIKNLIQTDHEALSIISSFMKDHGIVTIYKSKLAGRDDLLTINYNTIKKQNQKNEASNNLLELFKATGGYTGSKIKNVETNEIIRYINAMFRYTDSNKRVSDVLNDFAYNIYPVRNLNWIKNRQRNLHSILLTSQYDFNRILRAAAHWSPNDFSIDQRLSFLQQHGIILNDELKDSYTKLVNQDVEAWWKSSVRFDISKESTAGIFNKVIKNSSAYLNHLQKIKDWDEQLCDISMHECLISPELPADFYFHDFKNDSNGNVDYQQIYSLVTPQDTQDLCTPTDNDENDNLCCDNFDIDSSINYINQPHNSGTAIIPIDKYFNLKCSIESSFINSDSFNSETLNDNQYASSAIDSITTNYQLSESNIQMIKLKLFKKYQYIRFNSSEGRRKLFNFRNRPSLASWNKILMLLVESNTLSIVVTGKKRRLFIFNLLLDSNYEFLTYEYVIKSLSRSLTKETSKKLSASKLRKSIKLNLRPSVDEFLIFGRFIVKWNFKTN